MKTRISSVAVLFCLVLHFISPSANATLIQVGDKLAYDQTTNLMWYTGFDLYADIDNLNPMLAQLPRTTLINSQRVLLDWAVATIPQINTVNLTDETTFSIFSQHESSYHIIDDAYFFFGLSGEIELMDYFGAGLIYVTRGVNRAVKRFEEGGDLCWYDDWMPLGDHRCASTIDRSQLTDRGPSDYIIAFDEYFVDKLPFWLTANVRFIHSVPEPSSWLLLLGGLAVIAGLRKKRNS